MHFALSDEQQELATTVRSLLAKRADSAAVRAAVLSEVGYDVDLWRTLCDQIGVPALAIPEAYGGVGATLFETYVVLEELGRSLAPTPLLASLIAAETLLGTGAEPDAELLQRVGAGQVATLAWSGPATPASGAETVRVSDGRLHGTVSTVLFGDVADVLLVAADTGSGTALFSVEPEAEGVARALAPAMDPTQRFATLTFEGVTAALVAADATRPLARAHQVGTVAVTGLQVGCAQRALDMTVAYAKERVQFGRPIGSFQALKHRMADLLVELEMSRSASWAAAYAVANGTKDADRLVAAAASYCSDALNHIAAETVQLHGGIAITWEHDAQLVLKRAHALSQLFGQPHQRRALVEL